MASGLSISTSSGMCRLYSGQKNRCGVHKERSLNCEARKMCRNDITRLNRDRNLKIKAMLTTMMNMNILRALTGLTTLTSLRGLVRSQWNRVVLMGRLYPQHLLSHATDRLFPHPGAKKIIVEGSAVQ